MIDSKSFLLNLNKNLNILTEREAKYGGNTPLELLNQIDDHQTAIHLTEQLIANQRDEAAWHEQMAPLLIAISERKGPAARVDLYFTRTIPRQCPPRAEHFIGREAELAQLLDDLRPGRVATLCGPGGIGKTALAAEVLQDEAISARFPDGIIFYSFYGRPDPARAVALMSILVEYEREIGHPDAVTHAERVAEIAARLADDNEVGEGEPSKM